MGESPFLPKFPRLLTPVPVPGDDQYRRKPPVPRPSWWALCSGWFRYHSIQLRWDIERWLARILHRRWGA